MITIAAFFCLLSNASAESLDFPFARPYFENVGDREAIPGGVVTAMAHASNGILWLGTQSGLLRYDGYCFKHYEFDPLNPNSIADNFINALQATADRLIWIGTANDGLSILDPGTERFRRFRHRADDPNSLSQGAVVAFANSDQGMWEGTQTGLDRFDRQLKGFLHFPAPEYAPAELEISVTDDGIGMNAAHLAQVFEPFFTTKRNQGGTGVSASDI